MCDMKNYLKTLEITKRLLLRDKRSGLKKIEFSRHTQMELSVVHHIYYGSKYHFKYKFASKVFNW